MPTLIQNFNWGSALYNQNPLLVRQLTDAYSDTAKVVNTKISKYVVEVDPPNPVTSNQANKNFEIGDIWVNKASDTAWIMTSRTTDLLVTWTLIT